MKTEEKEIVKELLSVFRNEPSESSGFPLMSLEWGAVYISEVDKRRYLSLMEQLWRNRSDVFNNVTFKDFQKKMIAFWAKEYPFSLEIVPQRVEEFFKSILVDPIRKWEIFKPLYGVKLDDGSDPLEFGCYCIYDREHHEEVILTKYPNAQRIYSKDKEYSKHHLLVSIIVDNRDPLRAEELSISKFEKFENIMRFFIGPSDKYDISISEKPSFRLLGTLFLSDDYSLSSQSVTGHYEDLPIHDPFFKSAENGSLNLWNKLKLSSNTKMEERIISAINWIGKGLKDRDLGTAFVQFIFALERLFTFQEKGQIISSSIANQLSETAAFVLGTNAQDRRDVVNEIKDLYSKRSAIAHGGKAVVENKDLIRAYNILYDIIKKLLIDPDLKNFENIEQLQEWVNNKKFS